MKGYIFFADGSEECEGLLVVDLVRRAGIDIKTVSINDTNFVTTAHDVELKLDYNINDGDFLDADFIVIPGGIPGVPNIKDNCKVMNIIKTYNDENKLIAAICAAPSLLGELGILDDKIFTCYPGFEEGIKGTYIPRNVEVDGNILTGKGLGAGFDFALAIVEKLLSSKDAKKIAKSIMYN